MKPRKWMFPVSLCVLAVHAALYIGAEPGESWIAPRRIALSAQLSTSLTGLTPKLLLAAAILVLTALFGRWYCRLLCPAGAVQELFSRIGGKLGIRSLRHAPAPDKALLLIVIGAATLLGMRTLAQFTDPAGLFGRLVTPLAQALPIADQPLVLAITVAGALLLVVLPLFKGRLFCDRFCPVGALLGVAAQARGNAVPSIDKKKCVSCGKCEAVCSVQCIDSRAKSIAPGRCLGCGECAPLCPVGAIGFLAPAVGSSTASAASVGAGRRSFLSSAAVGAAGVFALSRPASAVFGWESPTPMITPPGTGGDVKHRQFCIGCQACVAACPMRIIRPKDGSDMRPVLDYNQGFCHYNCRACLDSCPAHAFDPSMTLEQRQRVRVARVTLDLPRCVVLHNNTACGACAEVCPTHALQMVPQEVPGRPTIPDFAPEYCIGCGACYHACPAEPRAFVVEGLNVHETSQGIRPTLAQEEETEPKPLPEPGELLDFPF